MKEIFGSKIYILDNDLFSLTINKQLLDNFHCTDVTKFDSEINFFRNLYEQPRIIFLDYRTNPQKGIEILKTIKELQPDAYVVFIVGRTGVLEALFSLNHGAFEYVIKDKTYASSIEQVLKNIQRMEAFVYKKSGDL